MSVCGNENSFCLQISPVIGNITFTNVNYQFVSFYSHSQVSSFPIMILNLLIKLINLQEYGLVAINHLFYRSTDW